MGVMTAGSLESFFQDTPPELVVEVASPRTRLYDRNRKKDVYEGFGIPTYWIIEPEYWVNRTGDTPLIAR